MDSPESQQAPAITHIGKYRVLGELGRGGMGVVYRGVDESVGREVAIKTLTQGFMSDRGMLARFYDEVRTTARLNHPNIVTVYHLGEENGTPYIVMERVEGHPLDKLLHASTPLSMLERLKIVEDTCAALGYAHQHDVIHRDVKPANIFVQPDGNVKLLDFGIARLGKEGESIGHTRTGNIIGTVAYMAPERLQGGTIDGRSDIFSAGVVLYLLLTGQQPFEGEEVAIMQKIMQEPFPPLGSKIQDYPAALDHIVERALAKAVEDRYSIAEEMADDLNNVIGELRLGQVHSLLTEGRRLFEAGDLTRARTSVQQLLRIQGKNSEARELLAEIQRHFTQRQLEERLQQLRQEAERALDDKRFDESLSYLNEGLKLDKANTGLSKLLDKVQREKAKQDRVNEFLRQADSARRAGDYKSAIAAAQKALKVDKSNSKIVALCNVLNKEAERVHRQVQAKTLLESARSEIGARRYGDAILLLKEIEQLDPTNPELPLLLLDANTGLDQAKRKEVIARLEDAVATATSYEQLQQVSKSVQEALSTMPAETALFRLNAGMERQLKEMEDRRFADETIKRCRDLRPRAALEVVRTARLRLPGDERLLSLEKLLNDRVAQQSVEERREEYLDRAREALKNGQFSEAVRTLEICQAEGIATEEILSLLEFAQQEDKEKNRLTSVRSALAHAEALIRDAAFTEAVEVLERALKDNEDAALRLLLNQGVSGRELLRDQIETILHSAGRLAEAGRYSDAMQLLATQPPGVLRSDRVKIAQELLEEESQQVLFRTVGRAYAAAEMDLKSGNRLMRRVVAASGNSTLAQQLALSFRSRLRVLADGAIEDVMRKSKALLRNRDKTAAAELAQTVSDRLEFASDQVLGEWQKFQSKLQPGMPQTGLMKRLRP
jgi:eukaryotic-like serine/threonine-protein kinase